MLDRRKLLRHAASGAALAALGLVWNVKEA